MPAVGFGDLDLWLGLCDPDRSGGQREDEAATARATVFRRTDSPRSAVAAFFASVLLPVATYALGLALTFRHERFRETSTRCS